eukprot:6357311-Lingulodinium_polyedra.AAC.1
MAAPLALRRAALARAAPPGQRTVKQGHTVTSAQRSRRPRRAAHKVAQKRNAAPGRMALPTSKIRFGRMKDATKQGQRRTKVLPRRP